MNTKNSPQQEKHRQKRFLFLQFHSKAHMGRITEELLRKRAEHNEGELTTLKEIALHQFDIEKIENLGTYCRHLQIVLLQNNKITKFENLNRLKELEYLNVAVNGISKIEGLSGCESLQKLDLTANYVDNIFEVENLKDNFQLSQLFLTGNPCTVVPHYREFVIHTLPQLTVGHLSRAHSHSHHLLTNTLIIHSHCFFQSLDGREIERSERLAARQQFQTIVSDIKQYYEHKQNSAPSHDVTADSLQPSDVHANTDSDIIAPDNNKDNTVSNNNSERNSNDTEQASTAQRQVVFKPDGIHVMQCNEGQWEFQVLGDKEEDSEVTLTLELSKYVDSSLVNVDVHPHYVHISVSKSVRSTTTNNNSARWFLVNLPCEVHTSNAKAERSAITGQLKITLKKVETAAIIEARENKSKEQAASKPAARKSDCNQKNNYSSKDENKAISSSSDNSGRQTLTVTGSQALSSLYLTNKQPSKEIAPPSQVLEIPDDLPPLEDCG